MSATAVIAVPQCLVWRVAGIPAPQGSAKAFVHRATGRVIVTHANAKTKPWRQEVTGALEVELAAAGLLGRVPYPRPVAVSVTVTFMLLRPKSLPKRIEWPVAPPDLDKLCRCALDAMTGYLFDDDSQVQTLSARKTYGSAPGALFTCAPVGNMSAAKKEGVA